MCGFSEHDFRMEVKREMPRDHRGGAIKHNELHHNECNTQRWIPLGGLMQRGLLRFE